MIKILVLSVGRSDFDRYLPILNILKSDKKINLKIITSNVHNTNLFGNTFLYIKKSGFQIINDDGKKFFKDDPKFISSNLSNEIKKISKTNKFFKPNLFIVLGDRYEMLAGAVTAIPFNIPVIHFYGGAITEGAIDELVRHSITKMSHFHFVAHKTYKKRLIKMGEEPWRVKNIGIKNIEFLKRQKKLNISELKKILKIDLGYPTALVTFHSTTLEYNHLNYQINSLLKALKKTKMQIIFSYPNADRGFSKIIKNIKKFTSRYKKRSKIIKNCSARLYSNLLNNCTMMVGNSSSGIVEAMSFNLPVVNIGSRQAGKVKPDNIIESDYHYLSIYKSIMRAKSKKFRKKIEKRKNPYESKIPLYKIKNIILNLKNKKNLLKKKFYDSKS